MYFCTRYDEYACQLSPTPPRDQHLNWHQTEFVVAGSVVFVALASVLVKLAGRFSAPPPITLTAGGIDELSVNVANLLRLLDEGFHSSYFQDASSFRIAFTLGIQRWKLMHEQLRHLENGFKLMCTALKDTMVESKRDRPDLAWALVRNQMRFAYGMVIARFRLVRFLLGVVVSGAAWQVRRALLWLA
jgi:hypothetical protein